MYYLKFLLILCLCIPTLGKSVPTKIKVFNEKYLPIIREEIKGTGIPIEVAVNQIREETGWCTSKTFKDKFNPAGIKNRKTGKYESYRTFREGVRGYIHRLKDKRYSKAFKTSNPRKFLEKIIEARYCEKDGKPDWRYVERILNLNDRFPLSKPKHIKLTFDYKNLNLMFK